MLTSPFTQKHSLKYRCDAEEDVEAAGYETGMSRLVQSDIGLCDQSHIHAKNRLISSLSFFKTGIQLPFHKLIV